MATQFLGGNRPRPHHALASALLLFLSACGGDEASDADACDLALAEASSEEEEPLPTSRVPVPDDLGYTLSPLDGRGKVSVEPDRVPVLEPVTLTFTYEAEGEGIQVGGGLVCFVSSFWGWQPPQDVDPRLAGFVTVQGSNPDVRLDVEVSPQGGFLFGSGDQRITVLVRERPLRAGDKVVIVYGDTQGGAHPTARGRSDRYAERRERFFFRVDGDGDGYFGALDEQPWFDVVAAEGTRLELRAPSRVAALEPFEVTLAVLDPVNNLDERYEGEVRIEAIRGEIRPSGPDPAPAAGGEGEGADGDRVVRVRFAASPDRGAKRVGLVAPSEGIVLLAASDAEGRIEEAISNPIVVAGTTEERYRLFWGDLHGHSNLSDGTGTPEDYYRYARDVARLDVASLTDHDHWGYQPLYASPKDLEAILEATSRFHEPGRFITFAGYEWTNWTYGHRHVLFEDASRAEVFPWHAEDSDTPQELWAKLEGRGAITIPHHPGGGPIPIYWKIHDPRFEPVVEIASVHGVSENMRHPQIIHRPVASGMVQSALARGYRLGIIASGDTHDGHPGLGTPGMPRPGLAGIYASELTRAAIFEALRARRVYGTTGCRATLRFHMGEVPMGGVVKLADPADERRLSVSVLGDAPVGRITIVKNNEDVARWEGEEPIVSWEWVDPEPAQDGDYYYARIQQYDDCFIWSSPIWVEVEGGEGSAGREGGPGR